MPSKLALPVIDISPYLPSNSNPPNDEARKSTSAALHIALRDVGFFYLDVSSYLTEEERRDVLAMGRSFFAEPKEDKELISIDGINGDGARGYQRLNQNVTQSKPDHHEGLDLYASSPFPPSTSSPIPPLAGENQWPSNPPTFRAVMEDWIEKMHVLGMAVMEAMSDALKQSPEEWLKLKSLIDPSFWVMRVIGYPPLPPGSSGISCGAHKDYGCLTLLSADPTPSALQVLLRPTPVPGQPAAGEEEGVWIDADPREGCLVVNVGEMVEEWTNGLYRSTLHRVIHRSENYRVSIPFFFEPSFDSLVEPLPAALRLQAQGEGSLPGRKYEGVVYGDFLMKKVGGNFAVGGKKEKY
ncbi:Clavaminate synthase-like protein [Mrakia frigida]|uniref:Clavaminate synthase-like protein n=1 Tax=Mrakia frigida TaxID=29902 RepID=UPI003FCC13FC